jgi:putative Ca2+/H+ antiporter (TMEM165/GDT1 family)
MAGFFEIMVVAAGFQLAVLPGEKVQFIIAGLSTRYNPLLVVAAAGTAFAGWTAVEILVGEAVQGVLPGTVLPLMSAALFVVFGYMLWQSTPEDGNTPAATDGGYAQMAADRDITILGYQVPDRLATFGGIFSMMAVGEFGDKTQIITFSLALQYGASPAIWVGEMLVIIPVSLANAYFFHRFAHRIDLRKAHHAAAALFIFFAADTVLSVTTGFSVWETVVGVVADLLLPVLEPIAREITALAR